ncbi:glycosyltransferase family 2 protein [uncultured Thermosynechococcus sp.]|uniref:glycosyltransferase family 2 protein n=1 Tax=uncultured Thermosynechococcus sp. TaxID=436945 RepID=UPI0026349A6E|nr:glycosyltransferase family 2 protein [uncultured Thermosynechococcus sp.]
MAPTVSVILPVYNQARYIGVAVQSILQQTYQDFELLILDDGSTDGSAEVIAAHIQGNPKVTFLSRDHQGLVPTLHELLAQAKGDYVARMDGDDIAHPERLEKQLKWIHQYQLDICGTFLTLTGQGRGLWRYPISHEGCEVELLFGVPFGHPSVVAKKEILNSLQYLQGFLCEDYDLWQRAWAVGGKMGNVPEPLLMYRIHHRQRSRSDRSTRIYQSSCIRHRHWEALLQKKLGWSAEQARVTNAHPWTWWRAAQLLRQAYQDSEARKRLGTAGLFRWCAHELELALTRLGSPLAKGVSRCF